MKTDSLLEAARKWISTWNNVPGSLIEKLVDHDQAIRYYDSDVFRLVASPKARCGECDALCEEGLPLYRIEDRDGQPEQKVPCPSCTDNLGDAWQMAWPRFAFPCGWGTLFVPDDSCDQAWVVEHARQIARLGFFVFESEDLGYMLGIDGAGFDFYDAFWVPLYQLRGLQWHRQAA